MEARDIFRNISPLDHRYSISEATVFESLVPWISEEAAIAACVRAEIALIAAHLAVRGRLTPAVRVELEKAAAAVDP
ncbi:MAG: adenylosuccinate lyase, partial [Treponema sp.]|nr:adenylosuccinate lyase [Treponema sp.]